jgi:hypothetical protein
MAFVTCLSDQAKFELEILSTLHRDVRLTDASDTRQCVLAKPDSSLHSGILYKMLKTMGTLPPLVHLHLGELCTSKSLLLRMASFKRQNPNLSEFAQKKNC